VTPVPGPITLTLERRAQPILRVVLPAALELRAVNDARAALDGVLTPAAGDARVGMLIDTRALKTVAEGAFEALGALEMQAGRTARVARVARLVADAKLAADSNTAATAAGIAGAVRAFTREDEALSFAEGA